MLFFFTEIKSEIAMKITQMMNEDGSINVLVLKLMPDEEVNT